MNNNNAAHWNGASEVAVLLRFLNLRRARAPRFKA